MNLPIEMQKRRNICRNDHKNMQNERKHDTEQWNASQASKDKQDHSNRGRAGCIYVDHKMIVDCGCSSIVSEFPAQTRGRGGFILPVPRSDHMPHASSAHQQKAGATSVVAHNADDLMRITPWQVLSPLSGFQPATSAMHSATLGEYSYVPNRCCLRVHPVMRD